MTDEEFRSFLRYKERSRLLGILRKELHSKIEAYNGEIESQQKKLDELYADPESSFGEKNTAFRKCREANAVRDELLMFEVFTDSLFRINDDDMYKNKEIVE